MELEELRVYQQAMDIGETVWSLVSPWNFLAKDTVGKQWIRSSDSIAANISEGYGRYSFKENKRFLFYARGSLRETRTWLVKARNRDLIGPDDFASLRSNLDNLAPQLNNYIRSIGINTDTVREEDQPYGIQVPDDDWQVTNDY